MAVLWELGNKSVFRILWRFVLTGSLLVASVAVAQVPAEQSPAKSLPDESVLPGSPAAEVPQVQLPDESHLPNEPAVRQTPPETPAGVENKIDSTPAGLTPPETTPPKQTLPELSLQEKAPPVDGLPPESELPQDASSKDAAGTESTTEERSESDQQTPDQERPAVVEPEPDVLRLQDSVDDRPWLTLLSKAPLNMVRAMKFTGDSQRLCVAGDDKSVLVYRRFLDAAGTETWRYERTIRWQVQRGPRGWIFALDEADGTLAFAGYGAMGSLREIVLADTQTGKFRNVLQDFEVGSQQRVTSVALAPGSQGNALAAMDGDGTLVYWQREQDTGRWQVQQLASDPENAAKLATARSLHPIIMPDQQHVIAPYFAGFAGNFPRWQLQQITLATGARQVLGGNKEYHDEMVTALVTSADGKLWASADARKKLFLWNLQGGGVRVKLDGLDRVISSLAISADGTRLLSGTLRGWDVKASRPSPRRRWHSCGTSATGGNPSRSPKSTWPSIATRRP